MAIVTGAARGIGRAYCLALVREGAIVVAADILSCAETVVTVQEAGGEAVGMTVDVTDVQSTQAMADQTAQRSGWIDMLVHNAAIYGGLKLTLFEQIPEAEWGRVMQVHTMHRHVTWKDRGRRPHGRRKEDKAVRPALCGALVAAQA